MRKLVLTITLLFSQTTQANAISYTPDDAFRLADVMYCEARGEGKLGLLAVADVVKNRVLDKRWANTVTGVIEQPNQFSCIDNVVEIYDEKFYETVLELAVLSLEGKTPTITKATHYYAHNKIKSPAWTKSMSRLGDIGNHRFYKD